MSACRQGVSKQNATPAGKARDGNVPVRGCGTAASKKRRLLGLGFQPCAVSFDKRDAEFRGILAMLSLVARPA